MKREKKSSGVHTWRGIITRCRAMFSVFAAYCYDAYEYARYTSVSLFSADEKNLISLLTAHAHVIEKGVNHPQMRPGFGAVRVAGLVDLLRLYRKRGYDTGNWGYKQAVNALRAYLDAHEVKDERLTELAEVVETFGICEACANGSRRLTREDIARAAAGPYEYFAKTRQSIRHFVDRDVDMATVEDVIALAQTAPSSCNRQSPHVYVVASDAGKKAVVNLHDGCRGFGDDTPLFMVVTADRRMYMGARERHQSYVDGGIFCMALLNALHYHQLGACTLNWAAMPRRDKKLKQALNISRAENIIALVAVGYPPEVSQTPLSSRKPVGDCFTVV